MAISWCRLERVEREFSLMASGPNKHRFELEALEPRCLLSSGVTAALASPATTRTLQAVESTGTSSSQSQTNNAYNPTALVGSILPSGSPTGAVLAHTQPAPHTHTAQSTPAETTTALQASKPTTPALVSAQPARTSGSSQVAGNPTTQQLTQTLTAANGPPAANSPSITTVSTLNLGPTSTTTIRIGGSETNEEAYDQINVNGSANLNGTLKIELTNGFVPQPGQLFKILTWGSRNGQFTNWLGTAGIPGHPDYYFQPIYGAHDLTLEVIDDPNIIAAAQTAINNGLGTLDQIGGLLNNVGSFAQNIPLIGDKLSSFIDSGAALTQVIKQQIQSILNGAPVAEAAVTSAIQSWDGTTVAGFQIKVNSVLGHYDATGTGPFWWDINIDVTPAAVNKALSNITGAALGAVMPSPPSVSVQGKLSVVMSFGYDSVFFIKLDHLTAQANVNVSSSNGFPINFAAPLLSSTVNSWSVNLAASITATPDASILTANGTTGARIEFGTLTSMAASSNATSNAFNFAKTSSLNAAFNLSAALSGLPFTFTGTTAVNVQASDLFTGGDPAVTVAVNGSLTVLGQNLTGTFTFKKGATETDLLASGVTLNLNVGAQRVLQATGSGEFVLLGSSDLAGTASLTLTQGPNIPGLTLTGTTFNLALNTSSGAVATIDGNTVNLPAGPYYRVSGHAVLGLSTPSANLTADFDFEPNGSSEVDVGIANLALNFDNGTSNLLSLTNGSGAFVILPGGMYGTAGATVSLTVPGVTLEGTFNLLMNTTGASQSAKSVNVNGTAVSIPALVAGPYLQVQATGSTPGTHAQLTVLGVPMMGDFLFENKTTNASHKVITVAAANVSFGLGTVSTSNLISITNGSGAFIITSDGVAGQGTVMVGVNAPGVTLSGTFGVAINQTSGAVNETVNIGGSSVVINLPAGPYLQVSGTGITLGFLGITITGDFSFEQKTTTTNTQLVTVVANNVAFNFGTSLITATGGSGFFVLNDSGIVGQGSITLNINAFGGFNHTFNWAFNNTDPALDQTVTVDGIQHIINQLDGPFNQLSLGSPVTLSITAAGQTQSIGVTGLVLALDSAHSDVLVGVSGLSTTVGTGGVTLHVGGGTGAFVLNSSGVAGLVNIDSTTVSLGGVAAGVTLTATHLQLQFNNTGADVGPVSVPVDNNPADNVTVQFTGAYYHNYLSVSGAASFGLTFGPITINVGGNFAFETPGAGQFKVGATDLLFDLKLGSGPSAFTVASFNHGSGGLLINANGLAGSISGLQFQTGVISMSGTIELKVNTTSSPVNTTVTTAAGTTIINQADVTGVPNDPIPANIFKVYVNGNLRVGSVSFPFNFYIVYDSGSGQFQLWKTSPNTELVAVQSDGTILTPGLSLPSLLDFAQPGGFDLVSMLKQLGMWLDTFRSSTLFDTQIPFTGGKTLGDAFDWTQAFINSIYSKMVSVEVQSPGIGTNGQLATPLPGGTATFQVTLGTDSNPGSPVNVSVPGLPSFLVGVTLTDLQVQSFITPLMSAFVTAGINTDTNVNNQNNRLVVRENAGGALVIALQDSEVAKGTKLTVTSAAGAMAPLGFGAATVNQVATLIQRYPTDNSNARYPSFFSALATALGLGPVNYDPARQVYTFSLNLNQTFNTQSLFGSSSIPFNWSADLGPIASASLSGALSFSATVGLTGTLGFDLTAKDVPRVLSTTQVPVPVNGQINTDAHFTIYLNDDPSNVSAHPVNGGALTLTASSTATDSSIDDLANKFNSLFHTITLSRSTYPWLPSPTMTLDQVLIAQKADTELAISAQPGMLGIVNRIAITSLSNDSFATELGFGNQSNSTGTMFLSASNSNIKGLFLDNASLSGDLTITTPTTISGSLSLGFVKVATNGGVLGTYTINSDGTTSTSPLHVGLSLHDQTTNSTRFYLSDLMNGTSSVNILNMVVPSFTGSLLLQLNNISVSGLGFSLPLSSAQISLFIPDIKNVDFNPNPYDATSNKEGLFITYPSLGDLSDLTNLNFSSIIQALQGIAQSLSQLSGFGFLNDKLPIIDMSVNDLIGYAAKFADLINAVSNGGGQSLQDLVSNLQTQVDQLFHLPPNVLQILLDNDGLTPSSLVTGGGTVSNPATASINPNGDKNAFNVTAGSNGTTLNGSFIHIVGSSDVNGTSANVSWNSRSKVLTIKINPGQTTTQSIVDAINNAHTADPTNFPWTAAKPVTDNSKPNDGTGTFTTLSLEFKLNYTAAYANTLPFHLDLAQLLSQVGGSNPGLAAFLNGVSALVQADASGTLTVSAGAALTLDFGLDMSNVSNIRPFFYDDTGVVLTARVAGTNLNLSLTLGSVAGIQIQGGSVTLDGDGDPSTTPKTQGTPDNGAQFSLTLRDTDGTGRHYFDSNFFSTDNINIQLVAGVSAVLPVYATFGGVLVPLGATTIDPNTGYPHNDLAIIIPDLARFFGLSLANSNTATVRFLGPNNDMSITAPSAVKDFTVVLQSGSTGANFDGGTNTLTLTIQDGVTTGTALQTAIQAISTPSTGWTAAFLDNDPGNINNSTPVHNDGSGTIAADSIKLVAPDLSSLFNNLDFCTILASATGPLLKGLDTLLGKLEDGINSITSATDLPLIGKGLSGAADFIQNFRSGLLAELEKDVQDASGDGLTAVQNAIKKAFWNSLGPGGLNLLVDVATGNPLDISKGYDQLNVTLDCNTGLLVKLRLAKELDLVDTSGHPIAFNIGVPGFGLQGSINVKVALGFDLRFGFGVSPQDGFFFDTSNNPALKLYFKISLPNTHFTGQLLFLQLDMADDTTTPSLFSGQFTVDFTDPNGDGKLTWGELTSGGTSIGDLFHPQLAADALVNLDLAASFGGNTAFPRVLAQFHLHWHFDIANGAGEPQISFNNIELDLGSFISNFLGPILSKIQTVTKPLQPIIDVATARIPILSDLAGHTITLLDLAQLFGLLEPSTVDFIKDVAQVITLINDIQGIGQGDILIPFGSFTLSGGSDGQMDQIAPNGPNNIDLQQSIINDPDPGLSSQYQNAAAGFAGDLNNTKNFSFPFFDHPSQLFNLFIGKPVSLIEWRMPQFKFTFTYTQQIPIYPPLYAQFGGGIGATINIGFGYDTFGIQEFISDPKKNPVDLLDGFYVITNDTNGKPQPALTLTGEIFAGADISLVIVEVGVRGGVSATVNFYWNDNSDNDGKMRVSEIIANALEDPRCIFNIEGSISLFLEAYLKIDLFFFSIDKTWRFATITLVSFDLTCPEPVLGSMSSGVLTLNMGPLASQRQVDDTSDGNETFIVHHISGSATDETVQVTWAQHTQTFDHVKEVDANCGQGDNVLDLRGVLATCNLTGGPGTNTIYLSDGPNSTVTGGSGNETITASKAATATGVTIHGGDGNDVITGGTMAITIYGDGGIDTITGSTGTDSAVDHLYGGAGDDTITAGSRQTYIDGGDGNDTIHGGSGKDFILGGAGDDVIYCGSSDNIVLGGDGNDVITGGAGNDLLVGGNGDNTIYGNAGSDLIIGNNVATVAGKALTEANWSALNTAVDNMASSGIGLTGMSGPTDTSSGNCFLVGGGGSDVVFGGGGNNTIYGGNFLTPGQTSVIAEDGNNFITGGPGNDTIFGDDAMGKAEDRNTGIAIKSSVWADTNGNHIRDSSEKGLGGVNVWLYKQSTIINFAAAIGTGALSMTTTDVDGSFQFVGLDPNGYKMVFSLPSSLNFTLVTNPGNVDISSTDSDAADTVFGGGVHGGLTAPFTVGFNTTYKAVSAGYTGNPVISVSNASVAQSNSTQTEMVFNVSLSGTAFSGTTAVPVEVDYFTADGNSVNPLLNATAAHGDYVPSGTQDVIFNPGESSKQITILVNSSDTYKPNQQFRLRVSAKQLNPDGTTSPLNVNGASGTVTALGTIFNTVPVPAISVSDWNPRGATPQFVSQDFINFTDFRQKLVTQTGAVSAYLWSQFSAADQATLQSATASQTQQTQVLISELNAILAGPSIWTAPRFTGITLSVQTSALKATSPAGDALVLLNRLLLQDAYSTDLAKTIAGATEGDTAMFVVTLSNPTEYTVTVDWNTDTSLLSDAQPDPAVDAAIPSPLPHANFMLGQGTLTFQPGQTTQVISVQTLANNYHQGDTSFWVDLSNSAYASIADPRGWGVIPDKDPAPTVTLVPVLPRSPAEPFTTDVTKDPSSPVPVNFYIQVSAASGLPVTVTWATSPGTAVEARGSLDPDVGDLPDYVGVPTSTSPAGDGQWVFTPGAPLSKMITVWVNPTNPYAHPTDTKNFFVNLLSADNATIAATPANQTNHDTVVIHQVVATTDAGPWSVFFDSSTYDVTEPAGGSTPFTFHVERTPGSSQAVAVVTIANGTAINGVDYTAVYRQLVRFDTNEISKAITINILADGLADGDETVLLSLNNPTGGPVRANPSSAVLTIHEANSVAWIEGPLKGSTSLALSDIQNLPGLEFLLAAHVDPVSLFLWNSFSAALQAEISAPDAALPANLTAALNTIIQGPSIYTPARFAAVTLSPVSQDWVTHPPTLANDVQEFNRWLLTDAYSTFSLLTQPNPALQASDFTDFNGLVSKLASHTDSVSNYLWGLFSVSLQNEILTPDSGLQTNLTAALNNILLGPSIYSSSVFGNVALSSVTNDWLMRNPTVVENRLEMNRWLLANAYPAQIGLPVYGFAEGTSAIPNTFANHNFTVYLSAPAGAGGVAFSFQTVDLTARSAAGPDQDFQAVSGVVFIPGGSDHNTLAVSVQEDTKPEPNETFAVRLINTTGPIIDVNASAAVATIFDDDLTTITGTVFYDTNGNGYQDLSDPGMPGVNVDITYYLNGIAQPVEIVTTDSNGNYTASVAIGQVTLAIESNTVTSPIPGLGGAGSTYHVTTHNDSQSVNYQGIVGLPGFADVGYQINTTPTVNKSTAKDAGRGGTDNTIYGGPGSDNIQVGNGFNHIVGGYWYSATDTNIPINKSPTHSYDVTVHVQTSGLPIQYSNGAGPIWYIDPADLSIGGVISGHIWIGTPATPFTQDVVVTLMDCLGNLVDSQTAHNGTYTFANLYDPSSGPASEYLVRFDLPSGYIFQAPGPNNDVQFGNLTHEVNISSGTPTATLNALITQGGTALGGGQYKFQFTQPSYSVADNIPNNVLTVTIQRGNSFTAAAIVFDTEAVTAVAGVDYVAVFHTLIQFNVGESEKTVSISILQTNALFNCAAPTYFNLVLRDPTGRPMASAPVFLTGPTVGDDDTINAGTGWNIVLGDSGIIPAPTIIASAPSLSNIIYTGGVGKDVIDAGSGPDFVNGGPGNDTIYADAGFNTIQGGAGDDTIYVGMDTESIDGGDGFNTIISNRDVPYISLTASGINATLILGIDNTGPGILSTHNLKNIQMAQLYAGPSDNTFDITNWAGSAFIVGGGGTDTLLLNTSQALKLKDATVAEANLYYSLYGFYKDAAVSLASGGQYDLSAIHNVFITLAGGPGGVTADASGYSRPVTFQDKQGNDSLIGGSANDTFLLDAGLTLGTESITGNGGTDTLDFSISSVGVSADLSQVGVSQTVFAGHLQLKLMDQLENLTGSPFGDTLTGDSLNNIINGLTGSDTLIAGAGNDTFPFDCDTPLGSKIINTIGAPGFNTLDFSGTQTQPITIDLALLNVAQVVNPNLTITVQGVGIRQVFGGRFVNTPGTFSNTIRGNASGDILHGGPYDDLLQGRSGNDFLDGRAGHNMLIGGGGVDTVLAQGDTNFTLTNTLLTQSDGTIDSLDAITLAILIGGVHANTFNITGWNGTASITGVKDPTNPIDDTLIAGADANFTLSDTSLDSPSFFAPITLNGIDIAVLTTGAGGHTLDASGFSGEVTLNGGDGNDTFILGGGLESHAVVNGGRGTNALIENYAGVVPNINFTVQDTNLLAIIDPLSLNPIQRMDVFSNIQSLTLTGGNAINSYDISAWHGTNLTLNGSGALNILTAQQTVSGTVTLTDTSLVMPGGGSITLNGITRAVITGTVGDDILDASGYSGIAVLHGGAGNDTLIAGSGLELLDGGPGNDRFVFRQFGALHTVFVEGGDGEDTLDFSGQVPSHSGSTFSLVVAIDISFLNANQTVAVGELAIHLDGSGASGTTPDIEDVIGSAGGGAYVGNSLDNVFTITGGLNNMNGTGGNNTIVATADANMTLSGGSLIIGPNNNLVTNFQTAVLTGGPSAAHSIDASGFTGTTILQAGPMGDTLTGGTGTNTFIDGPGNDVLRGNTGNNTYVFNVDVPQGQDTIIQLPGGINTLDFSAARTTGVTVNLAGGTQTVAPNLQLTLPANAIQNVIGTPQIDHLTGNTLNNTFTGNGGADVIVGGSSGGNAVVATGDNDYVLTDGSLTTIRSNAFLTAVDIFGVAAFVAKLQNDPNPNTAPVSQFLWSQFSPGIQAVLTNSSLTLTQRKDVLVAALNQVLQSGSIYDVTRFAGVSLSAQTTSVLGVNPTGDVLVLLNRFLLSDTYPVHVLANHDPLYSLTDIRDAVAFVARLQSDGNPNTAPISQFIWNQFSPATQAALTTGTTAQRAAALVNALNQLLLGNSLFDATRFLNVLLSAQSTILLGQNPTGANLIRLNRFLLVDTYRSDLAVSLTNIQFGVLTGGASNNTIDAGDFDHGGTGGVYAFGMDGNDTLIGGYGTDYLDGGNGNDKLYGGAGNNVLVGGAGDDVLNPTGYFNPAYGTAGVNILIGGTGNDTYSFDLSALKPTLANPTPPNPTVYVLEQPGEGYNDTITGLGPAGISVNLSAATQYFYLNLLTNAVQSSTSAPVGSNYEMLLTLDMSAPAVNFYRNLLTNGLQFVSGPNTQLLLSLPLTGPGGVENSP